MESGLDIELKMWTISKICISGPEERVLETRQKKRILIGTYCLSSGFYDAYYKKAQKIRNLISSDFVNAFKDVSSVMLPTTSGEAFDLGSITDPIEMYRQDIFTIPANLGGLPAISIPFGEKNKMPLGIQFIGNILEESSLLNISNKFQLGKNER